MLLPFLQLSYNASRGILKPNQTQHMKNLIKLEELGLLVFSIFLLYKLDMQLSWWLYIILFLSPDLGMIGYLFNTKIGAVTYNLFHHKAVAIALLLAGLVQHNNYLLFAGLILLAHSSFDRVLGYGLKYPDSFKHTNVGYM
jgi:hypothetical protein